MSGYLSNTLHCLQCKQTLTSCQCGKQATPFAGNISSTYTTGTSSGTGIYSNLFYCSTCSKPFGMCTCYTVAPYNPNTYQMTPNLIQAPTPNIMMPTPFTFTNPVIETDNFEVKDTENKTTYKNNHSLHILHKDDKEGLYVKLGFLELPIDLKECFYRLKNSGGYTIWHMRSPLTFRIDMGMPGERKVPHFLTLSQITNAGFFDQDKDATNHFVGLTEAHFLEVTDQLELIRLVEMQDVFVKLLRRL